MLRFINYQNAVVSLRISLGDEFHERLIEVDLYQTLVKFITKRYSQGHDCVLIIDEAQHLTAETLESLRLLSNINTGKDHLLKILLVGQPELSQTLGRPDLVQFAQRI